MRFTALALPWLALLMIGHFSAAVACLLLQLTGVGWIPAALYAADRVSDYQDDQRMQRALQLRHWSH